MINWASLHGADYTVANPGVFQSDSWPKETPAKAFSDMHSLGFNFSLVPLSWTVLGEDPTTFMSTLASILSAADANGVSLILDFFQIMGWNVFPDSMLNAYNAQGGAQPGYSSMLSDWWNNRATYSWQNMVDQFWKPIVQAADAHSSVVGYTIMDEPPLVPNMTVANMQQHNQFFASQLRALTPKAIVFDPAYNCPACAPAGYVRQVAPVGVSNLVLDLHSYTQSDPTSYYQSQISDANAVGVTQIVSTQWGPFSTCSNATKSTMQNTINLYYAAFKSLGMGNCYWAWWANSCSGDPTNNPSTSGLLDASYNPNWIAQMLSQAAGGGSSLIPTTLTLAAKTV